MKKSIFALLLLGLTFSAHARDISQYNLTTGVGFNAHDPVAVHAAGQTAEADSTYSIDYHGVIYNFLNAENASEFENNTKLYEPSYGGWCAYAMAFGQKIEINPNQFIIQNGRTHFFVNQRAKRNFEKDPLQYEIKADQQWLKISGESN